jgi:hypothetical protein
MASLAIREERADDNRQLGGKLASPMRLGIVDLIGGRGRHQPICIDDALAQLCRMRDEILKLVTERLAAESRCGVGQIKLQERFAERLLYDCQRSTLSRYRTSHSADLPKPELTTRSMTLCYRRAKQIRYRDANGKHRHRQWHSHDANVAEIELNSQMSR